MYVSLVVKSIIIEGEYSHIRIARYSAYFHVKFVNVKDLRFNVTYGLKVRKLENDFLLS